MDLSFKTIAFVVVQLILVCHEVNRNNEFHLFSENSVIGHTKFRVRMVKSFSPLLENGTLKNIC